MQIKWKSEWIRSLFEEATSFYYISYAKDKIILQMSLFDVYIEDKEGLEKIIISQQN